MLMKANIHTHIHKSVYLSTHVVKMFSTKTRSCCVILYTMLFVLLLVFFVELYSKLVYTDLTFLVAK